MSEHARIGHMEMVPGSGPPRRMVRCSRCDHFETVVCATDNPAQARKKLTAQGWLITGKGKAACPECVRRLRSIAPKPDEDTMPAVVNIQPDREATRDDRQKILRELDGAYDVAAGRYCGSETDQTVARRLGVLPGWVADVREQFFGPTGENDSMTDVAAGLALALDKAAEHEAASLELAAKCEAQATEIRALQARLEAIRSAVGPRGAAL